MQWERGNFFPGFLRGALLIRKVKEARKGRFLPFAINEFAEIISNSFRCWLNFRIILPFQIQYVSSAELHWSFFINVLRQGRSSEVDWGRKRSHDPIPPVSSSVSNIRDIVFYRKNYTNQKFHSFTVHAKFLDNIWRLFKFSNYIREIDHFTMNLLKRLDT